MSANVPNKGDVIRPSVFNDDGVVKGNIGGFGSGTSNPSSGEPAWLEGRSVDQDATNSLGAIGGAANSDPMFAKFYRDDTLNGSNSAESVAHSALSGAKSDPQDQDLPVDPN